jgi:hypothetical protein
MRKPEKGLSRKKGGRKRVITEFVVQDLVAARLAGRPADQPTSSDTPRVIGESSDRPVTLATADGRCRARLATAAGGCHGRQDQSDGAGKDWQSGIE